MSPSTTIAIGAFIIAAAFLIREGRGFGFNVWMVVALVNVTLSFFARAA